MTPVQPEKGLLARIIAGTSSLGSFSIASMGLGLLSTIVIARRFPAEAFGSFVLLQVVVSFLSQLSSLGLDLSISKFIAATEDSERKRDLVNSAILLRLAATFGASLMAWISKPLLLQLLGASLISEIVVFVPALFLLESTRNLLKAILQGLFCFAKSGLTDLITSGLHLLLLLTVVIFYEPEVTGLIVARATAVLIACGFAYLAIPIKKRLAFRFSVIQELIRFGFPLQLNDIMNFFFTRIDTLVIGALLGTADIAIYEVARKIPDSLRQLYEPFRSVYVAFSSRLFAVDDRKNAARLLNESTRIIAFSTMFGAAFALVYGRDIVLAIFSDRYLPSASIFALLMVNLSLSLVGNVLGTSLVTGGESDKPVVVNLLNMIVSVLGCVFLTPAWGVIGTAIGTTLGTAAVYPAMMLFLRRKLDAKVSPYLKPVVIYGVWAAVVLSLKPDSLVTKSVIIVMFLFICALLSVITKNDLLLLLDGSGVTSWGPFRRIFPRSGSV